MSSSIKHGFAFETLSVYVVHGAPGQGPVSIGWWAIDRHGDKVGHLLPLNGEVERAITVVVKDILAAYLDEEA